MAPGMTTSGVRHDVGTARDSSDLRPWMFNVAWIVGAIVIALAITYWSWLGLTQRSIDGDEGISILAGRAVQEQGIPELPSGMLYRKGIVVSYLLGAAFSLFGVNDVSILLPGLFFGAGSLVLMMLLARDLFGSIYVGIVASVWLLLTETQAGYATSPRMYVALQFFALLALWGTWHGFVRGRASGRVIAGIALGGAVLSHAQSGVLFVALPAAGLAVCRTRFARSVWRDRVVSSRSALILVSAAYGASAIVWLWTGLVQQIPGWSPRIADAGGSDPNNFDPSFDPGRAFEHLWTLESVAPMGLLIAPLLLLVVARAWRAREKNECRGVVFAFTWLSVCAILSTLTIGKVDARFWVMMLPMYLMLVCAALRQWILDLQRSTTGGVLSRRAIRRRILEAGGLAGWVMAVLAAVSVVYGPGRYPEMVASAYRRPGSRADDRNALSVKLAHERLAELLLPSDRVVATNPWVAHYYLGRVDGFLRERRQAGSDDSPWSFSPFDSPIDEYLGIPLIDTPEELTGLKESVERVWIVADPKFQNYSSQRSRQTVVREFALFHGDDLIQIYLNKDPSELPLERRP